MTWNELATAIAMTLGRPLDVPLKLKLIDELKLWRSRLMTDTLKRNPQAASPFSQTIFTKMEVNPEDCVPDGVICTSYRSTLLIPPALRIHNAPFEYVGSVDGKRPYRPMGSTGLLLSEGRLGKQMRLYDYSSHTQRVVTLHPVQMLKIRSVFDDPLKVPHCDGEGNLIPCNPYDVDIPATGDIIQKMQEYTLAAQLQKTNLGGDPEHAGQ